MQIIHSSNNFIIVTKDGIHCTYSTIGQLSYQGEIVVLGCFN